MRKYQQGFTIIELVLVFAITGLVIAVVLAGIGNSLRAERYRDATNQTIDFFQGLYSKTANVSNDREAAKNCDETVTSALYDTGGKGRGTSNCFLVGYAVRSSDSADTVTTQMVIARHDTSADLDATTLSESGALRRSQLYPTTETSSYSLEWGARLLRGNDPARFTMLIVRSPVSGVVRTYANLTSNTASIDSLLVEPGVVSEARFCIDPSGIFNAGIAKNGFVIDSGASNSSNVRQLSAGEC